MPFGPIYANEIAKLYGSPEEYIDRIDRMLAYMARYGHQDMTTLQTQIATIDLMAWVKHTEQLLVEENKNAKG